MGGLFSTLYHWRFYVSRWIVKEADLYDGNNSSYEIRLIDYYIDLITFQIYETAILLLVCDYFNFIKEFLFIGMGLIPLRVFSDGIHAKTKIGCIIYSTLIMLFLCFIGSFFDHITCVFIGFIASILFIKGD